MSSTQHHTVSYDVCMQALMDLVNDGVWDWHIDAGFVYRNIAWYRMLDFDVDKLDTTAALWQELIHPEDIQRVLAMFDACVNNEQEMFVADYRIRTSSGRYLWIRDTGRVVERDDKGNARRMIGAHTNINDKKILIEKLAKQNQSLEALVEERTTELIHANSELEKRIQEVERLAETDTLTRVSNRYRLEKTLRLEVERAHRFHHPLSVVALDFDNFKDINDLYGHACGDLVLIELAKQLKSNVREIDLVARWGGDEFMIVLPNTNLQHAVFTAEKLLKLSKEIPLDKNIETSISIGVVELRPEESAMRLSIRADKALYAAKASGKSTVSTDDSETIR